VDDVDVNEAISYHQGKQTQKLNLKFVKLHSFRVKADHIYKMLMMQQTKIKPQI
jgi:hypothetical protein